MKKHSILLVDDQPDNLKNIFDILIASNENYTIFNSINGQIACTIAEKRMPDLIIMDWDMPVMNGIDAIKYLKSQKKTKDIPVIMATGIRMSSEDLRIALEVGAIDFLRKPIDDIELRARVNSILKLSDSNKEIKRQKKELCRLNSTKDKFFSIIAHDLKSPFNSLINLTQFFLESFDNTDHIELRNSIKEINQYSKITYNLLENLLQWSRSQVSKIIIEPETIDIISVIKNNISILAYVANSKEINIKLKYDSENPLFVIADYNMINTTVRNLISNAIKFTRVGGTIKITVKIDDVMVITSIIDNGVGISEKNISNLFKIDKNFSTKGTLQEMGTGLGLILCQEFIEKNKGKIWVESKIDKGSKFSFSLPLSTGKNIVKRKNGLDQDIDVSYLIEEKCEENEIIKPFFQIDLSKISCNTKELIFELENLESDYTKVLELKNINAIKKFAKELINIGEKCNFTILLKYGIAISQAVTKFDVCSIDILLDYYLIFLKKLKEVKN